MWLLGSVLLVASIGTALDVDDVVYIILSQSNAYNADKAEILRRNLTEQASELGQTSLDVYLLHEMWPETGSWTILPIIPSIVKDFGGKKAVFFCEENSKVDLAGLVHNLNSYNWEQELFLGRGLRDLEPTIIHHYSQDRSFLYPDFASGFVISMKLMSSLSAKIGSLLSKTDFSIDVKHELAVFISDNSGLGLQSVSFLCAGQTRQPGCVTHYATHPLVCDGILPEDQLFVAIKTCEKYHSSRIVKATFTQETSSEHIEYYSETEDLSIPTVNLGVPNTETGHCGKLLAILNRYYSQPAIHSHDWLLIADDDTIISLHRLQRLLSCYDAGDPVVIGERYGYGLITPGGYDYPTGGSGMVLSGMAVRLLMESGVCVCGRDDAPDDMMLGIWLKRLHIPVTHSPLLHQARPVDYSPDYIRHQTPISFHKHWAIDPINVYTQYLADDTAGNHDEL